MNKTSYAIIAGLALTGCVDNKPEVRQDIIPQYESGTFRIETTLWVPSFDNLDGGSVGKRTIKADSVKAEDVEAVKQQQMEQIQPDYESALEFHKKVKDLE